MVVAAVLAGGVGLRFGTDIPKQFIKISGKPIVVYTLEKLNSHPNIDLIIVPCMSSYIETMQGFVNQYKLKKVKHIISGGNTFQESVKACVKYLEKACVNNDIFLIHMAISPMVSEDIISDSIDVCMRYGNAFSADPMYMCMCEKTGDNYSNKILDRSKIFGLNTPQSVKFGKLRDIYKQSEIDNFDINAEPYVSTIIHQYGEKLYFSKSSPINIKITTKDDLYLFEALLSLENSESE